MFGKKKAPLPEGIRLMHYEGLPGFAQDAPCFMEQTAEALGVSRQSISNWENEKNYPDIGHHG